MGSILCQLLLDQLLATEINVSVVTHKVRVGLVVEVKLWCDLLKLCEDLIVSGHVSGQDTADHTFSHLTEHFW